MLGLARLTFDLIFGPYLALVVIGSVISFLVGVSPEESVTKLPKGSAQTIELASIAVELSFVCSLSLEYSLNHEFRLIADVWQQVVEAGEAVANELSELFAVLLGEDHHG